MNLLRQKKNQRKTSGESKPIDENKEEEKKPTEETKEIKDGAYEKLVKKKKKKRSGFDSIIPRFR